VSEAPIRPYPSPGPPLALRPWNPQAPEVAARVVAFIVERLPDTKVEHVGSSSVPGCAGKGTLDLAIPYRDDSHLSAINHALFALGFERQRNRDPFPETRPMRIGAINHEGETFLLHVHVVPDRSHHLVELVDFRDRLRADPALVTKYVAVKRAILDAGVREGDDYAKRKGKFISALGYKGAEEG
jgi:GrpB-like predicted nucleotidyltransferase (UPF0157 family)